MMKGEKSSSNVRISQLFSVFMWLQIKSLDWVTLTLTLFLIKLIWLWFLPFRHLLYQLWATLSTFLESHQISLTAPWQREQTGNIRSPPMYLSTGPWHRVCHGQLSWLKSEINPHMGEIIVTLRTMCVCWLVLQGRRWFSKVIYGEHDAKNCAAQLHSRP